MVCVVRSIVIELVSKSNIVGGVAAGITTALLIGAPASAVAWGDLGHGVTALIAYRHLTPGAKASVDAMLAADGDPLTAQDFASRAAWADRYRANHRETAAWHFVDLEIDAPDLGAACFGFPALAAQQWASAGPAQDCIVNKILEFDAELRSSATPAAERLLALKFLVHFVGDLHQPLHASDHHDRGGNCVDLNPSPDGHDVNLHAYWDIGVVEALGNSADGIAQRLDPQIAPDAYRTWSQGDARAWALESFELSRKDVYALPSSPTCDDRGATQLTPAYQAAAVVDAALQLERAAVRIATLLNRAFGP